MAQTGSRRIRGAAQYCRVVARAEASPDNTFLSADIAGYTALTEAHGDEDAAELARDFCRAVSSLVAERGEVVKTIGDAVMVRYPAPDEAVRLGLRIAREVMAGHGFPTVRVGMHHGRAIERDGDWFGATVNVAARVAAVAAGGEVLLTKDVLEAAGELERVRFESRGERSLRNVAAPVALFAAVDAEAPATEHHLDPVCHMVVVEGREAGRVTYEDAEYRFCSLECIRRFADDPDCYLRG